MTTPPTLKIEVSARFGIDIVVKVILLFPVGISRVEALEVLHQPRPVKQAVANITGECRNPAASRHPAGIAHGGFAVFTSPVGEWRASNQDRAKNVRLQGSRHHDLPARLAIAHHHRFFSRFGMQLNHMAQKSDLRLDHILNGLAWLRKRQKTNKVAGVPRFKRHAQLTVRLKPSNPWPMPRTWVNHYKRALLQINFCPFVGQHTQQFVVGWPRQRPTIHQHFGIEPQHIGLGLLHMLEVLITAFAHNVQIENAALHAIAPVTKGCTPKPERIE